MYELFFCQNYIVRQHILHTKPRAVSLNKTVKPQFAFTSPRTAIVKTRRNRIIKASLIKMRSQYGGVIRGGQPQLNSSVIVPAREHNETAFPPKWPRVCGTTVWYCHRQNPGLYSIVISRNRLSPLSLWLLQTI